MSDEVEKSVAPLGRKLTTCPECGQGTAFTEGGGDVQVNKCTRLGCTYWERVTEDHIPREWSEVELRKLFAEVAIEINRN